MIIVMLFCIIYAKFINSALNMMKLVHRHICVVLPCIVQQTSRDS